MIRNLNEHSIGRRVRESTAYMKGEIGILESFTENYAAIRLPNGKKQVVHRRLLEFVD